MPINDILNRLDRVKETGPDKYLACCPAHDDKSPSLAITDDEGRVLLHCFAGCDPESVLAAIGLTFSDLYPKPLGHHFKPSPMRTSPREMLETLNHDSMVVAFIGADFLKHKSLDEETWSILAKSVSRINSGRAQVAPLKKWKADNQTKEMA